jgi:DNA-binding response OmpR family regulator
MELRRDSGESRRARGKPQTFDRAASARAIARAALEAEPPTILLAEDDHALRQLVAGVLRADGFHVLEAPNGTSLLDHVGTAILRGRGDHPVDLVITDIRMPGRSGLDVVAGLREADWSTPILVVTAFGSPDVREEALRLGALALIDKPFDLIELRAVARLVTGHRGASR